MSVAINIFFRLSLINNAFNCSYSSSIIAPLINTITSSIFLISLIASLINMDKKKAMLAITCGVLLAGLIVGSLSFGLLKGIIG